MYRQIGSQPSDSSAYLMMLNRQLIQIALSITQSVVMIMVMRNDTSCDDIDEFERFATGFAIDKNVIVSVAHAEPNQHICLADPHGDRFSGRIIGIDKRWDILFIESEKSLIPVSISKEAPPIGSIVLAYGMPFGLLRPYLSLGIVSSHKVNTIINNEYVEGLMIVSTPIMPGMSGGPVVDINGNVVGMILATTLGSNELALVLPSKRIYSSYNILNKLGRIVHIKLGIRVVEGLTKDTNDIRGVRISNVYNTKLSELCRIKVGDTILSINDIDVRTIDDLWDALDHAILSSGSSIKIKFFDHIEKKTYECLYPIQIL